MIDVSIDGYWNKNKNISNSKRGSYSLLFGYAEIGPSLTPVFAESLESVYSIFGNDSLLSKEYYEFTKNGGTEIWLIRINGSHCSINIQGLLTINTLNGLDPEDTFSYRKWDFEQNEYLSLFLNGKESRYTINGSDIYSLCNSITSDGYFNNSGIYAEYKKNGFLNNHDSSLSIVEEKILFIEGVSDTKTISEVFDDYIYDIISNLSPKIVGFSGVGFDSSNQYPFDFFDKVNKLVDEKASGLIDTIPIISIFPFIGNTSFLKEKTEYLISFINENPASSNIHEETFTVSDTNKIINLKFHNIYNCSVMKNDGEFIEDYDTSYYTINEKYGIIEITESIAETFDLIVAYMVEKPNINKLICLTYNNTYSNDVIISTGVGILMGKIISIGFDDSIQKKDIIYLNNTDTSNFVEADLLFMKTNNIICTIPRTIGTITNRRFVKSKTFYSNFLVDTPIVDLSNINVVQSLIFDISEAFEKITPTKETISLVIDRMMIPYSDYINQYRYNSWIEYNNKMFQKTYVVEIDIQIDGIIEQIKIGCII